MSDKKQEDRNIRKITRIGSISYGITIPIEVIRKFGWKERQKVILKIDPKKKSITIKDWKG
jgi:bifunctional DNA-binding transcriptional regulator/antitoxin component of YhaV-PrlF toxin-antitoxin module